MSSKITLLGWVLTILCGIIAVGPYVVGDDAGFRSHHPEEPLYVENRVGRIQKYGIYGLVGGLMLLGVGTYMKSKEAKK